MPTSCLASKPLRPRQRTPLGICPAAGGDSSRRISANAESCCGEQAVAAAAADAFRGSAPPPAGDQAGRIRPLPNPACASKPLRPRQRHALRDLPRRRAGIQAAGFGLWPNPARRASLRPAARGRTGCSGAPRAPARPSGAARRGGAPCRSPPRHRGRDDLAAVDEPVVGAHLDRRVELGERVEPAPPCRGRAVAEQACSGEHERAGADARHQRPALAEAAQAIEHRRSARSRRVPTPPG